MDEWMQDHLRRIRAFEAMRAKERQEREHDTRVTVGQLMRFNVCPCVALGRYSTCCKPLDDVKDGFFYVNTRR